VNNSMNGRICLVTGATGGIGKATAAALADMGATVVIVGRNPAKCEEVVAALKQSTGNNQIESLVADLSIMGDVQRLAGEFKARYQQLHVLINNAGGTYLKAQRTSEGLERMFALNHLSYFYLTSLLLDTLKASAPARVVNVASNSHKGAQIDFDDLQCEKGRFSVHAYGRSKLANVVFSYELARRLSNSGVTVNVLHPGLVRTGFASNMGAIPSAAINLAMRFAGMSPEQGAQTSVYLASAPEVESVTGRYWEKCKPVRSGPSSYDVATWTRLWTESETLLAARAVSR
jgi:NAD(P)-dependent dehydrogenase (short-subunit alcohol dehydrogenase family)